MFLFVEEYLNDNIKEFIKLLKIRNSQILTTEYHEIDKEEWRKVVKKLNNNSILSIFSKQSYSVYKYAFDGKIIIEILIKFYNTIIQKRYYLNR